MESTSPTRSRLARLSSPSSVRLQKWLPHVWLLPVLLVAAWLRLASLHTEHLYGDEAEYAIVARYLSRDPTYLAYPMIEGMGPTPFVSQPPLLLYTMAIFMKIMGPTDLAALLPFALLGIGTVAVVYGIGYRLGGRMMGLASAALLAAMPFHVEMSRRAMLDAGYVFFLALTLYFLVAWLQTRRIVPETAERAVRVQRRARRYAVWAGVAAAACALSKLPGMLAVAIALVVFLVALVGILARRAAGRATTAQLVETLRQGGLGALPVAAGGLLYLGFLWWLEAVGNLYQKLMWQLGRVDTSLTDGTEATQAYRDASFYLTDPSFGLGALLGGLVVALAIAGIGAILVRSVLDRKVALEHAVVPIALVVLASFFFWSDRKEGFYLLPFAPLAALLVGGLAAGLRDLVAWAGIRFSRAAASRVAVAAAVLGAAVVAVPTISAAGESYHDFALGETEEKWFGYGTKEAALWIQEHDPEAGQYGTLLGRFTLLWYNEQPTYHWYVSHTFIEQKVQSGELKYIVYDEYLDLAFDESFMQQLINKYNGRTVADWSGGNGDWAQVKVVELNP